jgi:hypothetical protein
MDKKPQPMQNSFEKDVQQKMDELRLTPSAPVWEKVAIEIRAEKKKRRGIIWFLLAGLLLAGAWLLYPSLGKQPQLSTEKTSAQPENKRASNNLSTHAENKGPDAVTDHKEGGISKPQQATTHLQKHQRGETTGPATSINKASDASNQLQKSAVVENNLNVAQKVEKNIASKQTAVAVTEQVSKKLSINSSGNLPINKKEKSVDSAEKKTALENALPNKPDTVLKRKVASATQWKKRLTVNAGWSGYADIFNSQLQSAPLNYSYSATSTSPGVASKVAAGPSLSIGFSLSKKIGGRWEFAAGIQYTYASTHQKVGDKKQGDTAVRFSSDKVMANSFYNNAGTNNYTNRFHFIEMPVSLSFKPSLHLPLYVSVGASYGRLLSTTALTFSSASSLYYQNKSNYLRNTLPVFTSVQWELYAKKRFSLRTGPFIHYNLLKLRKENDDGTPHQLLAGLQTAINL